MVQKVYTFSKERAKWNHSRYPIVQFCIIQALYFGSFTLEKYLMFNPFIRLLVLNPLYVFLMILNLILFISRFKTRRTVWITTTDAHLYRLLIINIRSLSSNPSIKDLIDGPLTDIHAVTTHLKDDRFFEIILNESQSITGLTVWHITHVTQIKENRKYYTVICDYENLGKASLKTDKSVYIEKSIKFSSGLIRFMTNKL